MSKQGIERANKRIHSILEQCVGVFFKRFCYGNMNTRLEELRDRGQFSVMSSIIEGGQEYRMKISIYHEGEAP